MLSPDRSTRWEQAPAWDLLEVRVQEMGSVAEDGISEGTDASHRSLLLAVLGHSSVKEEKENYPVFH